MVKVSQIKVPVVDVIKASGGKGIKKRHYYRGRGKACIVGCFQKAGSTKGRNK